MMYVYIRIFFQIGSMWLMCGSRMLQRSKHSTRSKFIQAYGFHEIRKILRSTKI